MEREREIERERRLEMGWFSVRALTRGSSCKVKRPRAGFVSRDRNRSTAHDSWPSLHCFACFHWGSSLPPFLHSQEWNRSWKLEEITYTHFTSTHSQSQAHANDRLRYDHPDLENSPTRSPNPTIHSPINKRKGKNERKQQP